MPWVSCQDTKDIVGCAKQLGVEKLISKAKLGRGYTSCSQRGRSQNRPLQEAYI